MKYTYKTSMVCSQQISFDIEGNVITNVSFIGGCNGNLKAVSKLVEGMTVEEIEAKLKGNLCGRRPTFCAQQAVVTGRSSSSPLPVVGMFPSYLEMELNAS